MTHFAFLSLSLFLLLSLSFSSPLLIVTRDDTIHASSHVKQRNGTIIWNGIAYSSFTINCILFSLTCNLLLSSVSPLLLCSLAQSLDTVWLSCTCKEKAIVSLIFFSFTSFFSHLLPCLFVFFSAFNLKRALTCSHARAYCRSLYLSFLSFLSFSSSFSLHLMTLLFLFVKVSRIQILFNLYKVCMLSV